MSFAESAFAPLFVENVRLDDLDRNLVAIL
jgi:hypothetical protein